MDANTIKLIAEAINAVPEYRKIMGWPDPPFEAPHLTDDDARILAYLNSQHPILKQLVDIEADAGVSRRTAGERVNRLVACRVLHRPEGERQGVGLTPQGIGLIKSLPTIAR